MYTLGEEIFYYRAGPHDFSCATCHEQSGMRIRLQALPDLTSHTAPPRPGEVGPPTVFLRGWSALWDGGYGIASASSDGPSCKWAPRLASRYKRIWR